MLDVALGASGQAAVVVPIRRSCVAATAAAAVTVFAAAPALKFAAVSCLVLAAVGSLLAAANCLVLAAVGSPLAAVSCLVLAAVGSRLAAALGLDVAPAILAAAGCHNAAAVAGEFPAVRYRNVVAPRLFHAPSTLVAASSIVPSVQRYISVPSVVNPAVSLDVYGNICS